MEGAASAAPLLPAAYRKTHSGARDGRPQTAQPAAQDAGLAEIVVAPEFANIRQDPRWLPFLRKIGRATEQLDAIVFDPK